MKAASGDGFMVLARDCEKGDPPLSLTIQSEESLTQAADKAPANKVSPLARHGLSLQ
jgi:hypothetical protein